jgi:hypothetical protein
VQIQTYSTLHEVEDFWISVNIQYIDKSVKSKRDVAMNFPEWFYYAHTSPTMSPLLEIILELLLWNRFQCCRHILYGSQYPEIFVPLRQTLFLGTCKSYSETNQRKRGGGGGPFL